jgi:hypothetical protein
MAFMLPVIEHGAWFVLDGDQGGCVVPVDVVGDVATDDVAAFADYYTIGGSIDSVERREGWCSRLSAPGFMDATDWTLHDTEAEARAYLRETHEVCPFTGDDLLDDDGGCDCMLCVDAEPSPGSCTEAHRLCSHDGVDCTRCTCGDCFDNPEGGNDGQ